MKLQARSNLNYILFSAIIYVVIAVSFYLAVEHAIYEEVDKRLLVERSDFEHFIDRNKVWEASCYFVEDKISVVPSGHPRDQVYSDTLMQSRYNAELVPFRQVSFDRNIEGSLYRVSIRKSLIESNELLKIITIVMLLVLSGGLWMLYLIQKRTAKKLWQPFFDTLVKAKSFDVNKGDKLTLSDHQIYEFNELNSSLNKMTDKILSDYKSLREFTENASHEIQTPLALINTRVEGLIQDAGISGKQMGWIQDIHESALRLSKLNQALLLLAKIDNGQFHSTEGVDFKPHLQAQLNQLEEVFGLKAIKVSVDIKGSFLVNMNPLLAEILLTNLLNNAVRHNLPGGGTISITLSQDAMVISNTGETPKVNPAKLFERFQKVSKSSSSLGLGLAIVKEICDISGIAISYEFIEGQHVIKLSKSYAG